jgi:sugar/nucleoside kinase (ribokinase family)
MSSPIGEAAVRAAELARAGGATLSVDLASTRVIRAFGPDRLETVLARLRPETVFATDGERSEAGLSGVATTWVLKGGARGCAVERDGERTEFPAVATTVLDTTGAGDAFAAGYLVGGIELALETAARAISQLGATP